MTDTPHRRHVVTVHGTFSGRPYYDSEQEADAQFFCEKSPFAKTLKKGVSVDKWHEFSWTGENLESDRQRASRKFTRFMKSLNLPPEDEVLVLAHSHGGNVALDGLRDEPVPNPISLYTFGTPFIWKETRFFLSAVAAILPNIIFFLAIMALAVVIGLGHFQSIAYGIPFVEIPRNAAANEFFKNFNDFFAYPAAIIMISLAAFWLIVWPLKNSRYRARFRYLDVKKFQLTRIWRTDDEAVAVLSNEPNIAVPISIFNSFFRFVSASLFVGFVLWAVYDGYFQFLELRAHVDRDASWNYILPMGGEKIGLGLSVLLCLLILYPIISFVFRWPLTWIMSRPVNSLLRKTAMGEDGYIRIDAHNRPDIPRQFDTEFNEKRDETKAILAEVKKRSDDYLVENRTAIMRALSAGDGYFQDILEDTDLTRSLIHCNYFTNDMARFIAEREAKKES